VKYPLVSEQYSIFLLFIRSLLSYYLSKVMVLGMSNISTLVHRMVGTIVVVILLLA